MWHAGIATNITAGSPERLSRRTGSQRITRVIRQRTHAPRRPVSGRTKVSSRRASVPVKGYCIHYVRPGCHSVTCPVGTHDLCVRPRQRLFRQILQRRDCNDNGRTDRASVLVKGYSVKFGIKYCNVVILTTTDALRLNTIRASLH